MKLRTRQEIEDFVRGCTFYGTGGGGLPANGIQSLTKELEAGREIGWVDISRISDDALSVCPFLMGSIAPHDEKTVAEMASYGMTDETSINREADRLAKAIQELSEYVGKEFDVVVPIELGGANTPGAIAAASKLGMAVVDGDYTSRAIPEIVQITFNYQKRPILPVASVDEWGNVCIIKESVSPRVTEKLGKLISVAGYGLAGQAGMMLGGKGLRETLIPGTLSECYQAGKMLREAREAGKDPVRELVAAVGGYELCRGTITAKDDYDEAGYYWGTVTIDCGADEFKYWFKNENHIVWRNGEPYVTSPDLISAIDIETGEPVPNPLSYVGQKIALVGIPCKPQLECQECYDVLTPRYFGYDIEHVSIREVMKG
jgi:DUF917 family protein